MARKYTLFLTTQLYDMSVCKYTGTSITVLQKFEFKSDNI